MGALVLNINVSMNENTLMYKLDNCNGYPADEDAANEDDDGDQAANDEVPGQQGLAGAACSCYSWLELIIAC